MAWKFNPFTGTFDIDTDEQKSVLYTTVGVYGSEPTFTDNGDGTADLGAFDVCLRDSAYGLIDKYSISATTGLSFTDGGAEYIIVNYNSGTPTVSVTSNYALFDNATIVPIYKCWRVGTTIHSLSADAAGNSLAEKIDIMISSTNTYNRSGKSGLMISESVTPNPRTVIVTSSYVFAGTVGIMVSAYNSSTDILTKATVAGGVWSYSSASAVYDNINYNPTTGETALGSNNYGVRWFYRSIGDVKEVFYVEGTGNHPNVASAEAEAERSDLPNVIKQHCLLVGRAIIRKGATSGTTTSAFEVRYSGASTIDHNDTSNIQGGASGDYYHLTSAQVSGLTAKHTSTISSNSDIIPKITSVVNGSYTYTFSRDGYGKWSSIGDGTNTWTITRAGNGKKITATT